MTLELETRIRIVLGDITLVEAEAIVTAANRDLVGGGGVDGAVHDAAGPQLVAASRAVAPCPAGSARITGAFNLACRFVIHAVGPIFRDLDRDSPVLASCYNSALSLAAEHGIRSVAFPCISTGAYGFPHDGACDVAIDAVVGWLRTHDVPERVTFCCFEQPDFARYRERLTELGVAR